MPQHPDEVGTEPVGTEPVTGLRSDDERLPAVFGDAYPQVVRFAELLTGEGVKRGLIGPREVPRLWERHLVNSAAIAAFLPATGTVVDVGSGAGLPGVVLAAMRPELRVILLEPMERRAAWLTEVVAALGLTSAEVLRGRAEDLAGRLQVDAVTARAVAPLDRLAAWTLPLLGTGGVLLAMKGSRAADEVEAAAQVIRSLGGGLAEILEAVVGAGLPGTVVVRVVRELVTSSPQSGRQPGARAPSSGASSGKAGATKRASSERASSDRASGKRGSGKRASGKPASRDSISGT